MSIRPARIADLSRMAEIYIFNNRLNFFPIFREPGYSFCGLQVIPLAERWLKDPDFLRNTYVYAQDDLIFGFVQIIGKQSEYVGHSPFELHWPHSCAPQISYREMWMNGIGEL